MHRDLPLCKTASGCIDERIASDPVRAFRDAVSSVAWGNLCELFWATESLFERRSGESESGTVSTSSTGRYEELDDRESTGVTRNRYQLRGTDRAMVLFDFILRARETDLREYMLEWQRWANTGANGTMRRDGAVAIW